MEKDNSFATVWKRIEANQGKPFLMENGREFYYQLEGESICFSNHRTPVLKETIRCALTQMPCKDFRQLDKGSKPRNIIWTLLNDTRIFQHEKFTEYEPSEFWERRKL
jgi:hypothetical protein